MATSFFSEAMAFSSNLALTLLRYLNFLDPTQLRLPLDMTQGCGATVLVEKKRT